MFDSNPDNCTFHNIAVRLAGLSVKAMAAAQASVWRRLSTRPLSVRAGAFCTHARRAQKCAARSKISVLGQKRS